MDFGSKYVYKYNLSEEESLSDDDDYGVHGATRDSISIRVDNDREQHEEGASGAHRRRRFRKPDTNVISVKFNQLLQPGEMHAGDPVYCSQCGAIASHLSQIEGNAADANADEATNEMASKWKCEFCPQVNRVDIEQADLPKHEDATYLLAPAPVVQGSDMTGVDDSMVFFLIDISGSMSSTTLVQGAFELPNAMRLEERAAEQFGGEHMIRQRHQQYVSRLQGVQMAVAANLDKLVKDAPTKRAALLTFNHEITYYGDGTRDEPLVLRGDKLKSIASLNHEAERELNHELKPVAQTKAKLTERVYDLEEGGQTALGPAVVFALNIASKRPGSRIVVCTDGLANQGLGFLEAAQDQTLNEDVRMQALEEGNQFYADITERARDKGVSISVITIKGTSCLLPVIGQMADGTGGSVTIVDLMNMRDEFASILEQQVTGTNVEATFVLHLGLYIRDPDHPDEKLQKLKRNIGNVTKQTEVTFEFGVRNKEELKEKYQIDLDQLKQLPFQIQVTYTAADGSKALRVLTQSKETTENRDVAEVNAIRSVIAENHIRSTANDMMAGVSDEDDYDAPIARSKWSKPNVQRQRMAYMSNLQQKVRERGLDEADQFNERRWNVASNELQSQVIASRSRKARSTRDGESVPNRSIMPIERHEEGALALPPSSRQPGRRDYGFDSSKVGRFDDQHSENLYRYKNMSSDYMRETSPTHGGEPAASSLMPRHPSPRQRDNKGGDDIDDEDDDDSVVYSRKPPAAPEARRSRRN